MKVGEIKKLKSGKYKVAIGNEVITTYDDVILQNHLLYQKDISNEDYEKLLLDSSHAEIYHKALAYVLKKVRSVFEVEEYLKKFEIEEKEKNQIISHLQKIGVLSDSSYVKAYLSDSLYLSNDGPNKIKEYLISQKIDQNIILEEMDKIDSSYIEEKMNKIIQKKLRSDHKHSSYQLKQKIVLDMVNLGYDRDIVLDILSTITIEDSDKLEKEYDKLYHKFEKRYPKDELFRKIQEKLYSKGFDIHSIEKLIATKKSENF